MPYFEFLGGSLDGRSLDIQAVEGVGTEIPIRQEGEASAPEFYILASDGRFHFIRRGTISRSPSQATAKRAEPILKKIGKELGKLESLFKASGEGLNTRWKIGQWVLQYNGK